MNYAVIRCVNGAFAIHSEHGTDMDAAFISFLDYWSALLADPDFHGVATVRVVDSQLDTVGNMMAVINRPQPEPEPQPEIEEEPNE